MITIKTSEEIEKLKVGGNILSEALRMARDFALSQYKGGGLTTLDIDKKIEGFYKDKGVGASFKGYTPSKDRVPFSGNACISTNEEVVHGMPKDRILKEGDLVSVDSGLVYDGLYTDASISFILGEGSDEDKKLIEVAKNSLYEGIKMAKVGNKIGDISSAIGKYIKKSGFGIVKNYCGHGVGYGVHEDPNIPNHGNPGMGEGIKEGMVFAIEPMVTSGTEKVVVDGDEWTVKTSDGKRASHWEHTVVVTKDGPMVITE